jgi:hypothetical protein
MALSDILASIDKEIAQLQHARAVLSNTAAPVTKKKVGRPRKIVEKAAPTPVATRTTKKKRNLSPEGRKRIAEAVKRRWASQKKATA